MTFQTIPTAEEAQQSKVARLVWSAAKKMEIYQSATGAFAANDLFSGEVVVENPDAFIENCKTIGITVFREKSDYSGFDKL